MRFGYNLLEFPDFSWRGYAQMSPIQVGQELTRSSHCSFSNQPFSGMSRFGVEHTHFPSSNVGSDKVPLDGEGFKLFLLVCLCLVLFSSSSSLFYCCLARRSSGSPECWCPCRLALRTSSISRCTMLTGPLQKFWEGFWFWRVTGATTVPAVSVAKQEVSCQALVVIGG